MVMPAMGTNLATRDGYVTEQMKDYYEERAKGGVGLVIVEVACVDSPTGKNIPCQLLVDDDKFIPGLSELAEVIHRHGVKAALQLSYCQLLVGRIPGGYSSYTSISAGYCPEDLGPGATGLRAIKSWQFRFKPSPAIPIIALPPLCHYLY